MKKNKVADNEIQEENVVKECEETQKNDVEQKSEELQLLNDKYLRLAAEFDNYRRRTLKERQELILTAGENLIVGILPILDDFERALDMLHKAEGDNNSAIEGTELIFSKLLSYLNSKGLKTIEAMGEELDTDFHEAVALVPSEKSKKKNIIVDVVQKGYTLNGKVIRFAKVVVAQ